MNLYLSKADVHYFETRNFSCYYDLADKLRMYVPKNIVVVLFPLINEVKRHECSEN